MATQFELCDIVRIGKGARRWAVCDVMPNGYMALTKLAEAGEASFTLGIGDGVEVPGATYGATKYISPDELHKLSHFTN